VEIIKKGNILEVHGIIKTMSDATKINEMLEEFREGDTVIIDIIDSFVVPSMLIGGLLKIEEEGINIELKVHSDILYEVLDDLNLIDKLHVKRVD